MKEELFNTMPTEEELLNSILSKLGCIARLLHAFLDVTDLFSVAEGPVSTGVDEDDYRSLFLAIVAFQGDVHSARTKQRDCSKQKLKQTEKNGILTHHRLGRRHRRPVSDHGPSSRGHCQNVLLAMVEIFWSARNKTGR